MKTLILILIVILNNQFYSQQQTPDFIMPITVSFDIYFQPLTLEIGLDSTATDGIDSQLGESELPPIPPPGWEAFLELPTSPPIAVLRDIRFGEIPYTGYRFHRLRFLSQYGVTIHWDIPEGISGVLEDPYGGFLIWEVMVGQDSFYLPYTFINELFITIHYSEPSPIVTILNEIIVSDGTLPKRHLHFGLSEEATDGIDLQLGEADLPPFPPPGTFEARFFLPENNFSGTLSSYSDFRYAIFPFTGQREWRIAYQTWYGNQITISWNFPSYLTGVLQDIINGTFINVPMIDSGSYIVQDPYIFNRLRMLIDYNIEIPVELLSFNTTLLDNNVRLDWTTATETNNSGFEIERKALSFGEGLGEAWNTIGFIPGFGTTTEPKSYSFIDEGVTTGTYKYRLKQIDFDGSFTYSNEIEVVVDFTPKEFVLYQNYPNPFNPMTVISYQLPVTGNVTLKVYDILGNEVATLVNEEKQPGVYEVEFSVGQDSSPDIASGIYFYKLKATPNGGQAGSFSSIKKMILLK